MVLRPQRRPLFMAAALFMLIFSACGGKTSVFVAPTATSGSIQLTTDRTAYPVDMPIGVLVTNTSSDSYYAVDGRSGCSFLQLQQYDTRHKQWNDVDPCSDGATPQSLLIRPGQKQPFALAPGLTPNANTWVAGSYRVALFYTRNSDGKTNTQAAYSSGFTIK